MHLFEAAASRSLDSYFNSFLYTENQNMYLISQS